MIVCGVDVGRSGKTAFNVLYGDSQWNTEVLRMEDHSSISAPDVERYMLGLYADFNPDLIVIEGNGPGGVMAEYALKNNVTLPIYLVFPEHPPFTLYLWNTLVLHEREFLNIRAEQYFILRYLFRDNRIVLPHEDPELFAQLTGTYWEADKTRDDKIRLMAKKSMRFSSHVSELEGYDFSRSPDKADALALAALGYSLLMQEILSDTQGGVQQEEEITDPIIEGLFNIGRADIEVEVE